MGIMKERGVGRKPLTMLVVPAKIREIYQYTSITSDYLNLFEELRDMEYDCLYQLARMFHELLSRERVTGDPPQRGGA